MRDHTFIFSDLVGFTALTEANGDEHAAELALDFYERVRTMLPGHGLRMVSGLEAVPGFPPVRVGMHTGPAISREGDWYGATVNVAARLCAAAGGGEVLVGESTLKAAGRMRKVRVAERRLHWLKNVTEPIPARLANERPCPPGSSFLRPLLLGAREVVSS